jgi:branched-chain amino acid transport system substrate-binding protein
MREEFVRKIRISRRSAVGGLLASTLAAPMVRGQGAPIRIGCMQTLSGSLADIGKAHLLGAQIAVKQVNAAGGIDGRQIELVVRDPKFSPAEGVTHLRELAGSGHNLIVGEAFSHINLATAPLAPQLNVVLSSPSTILMQLTKELYNRNFFRVGPNSYMQYNGETTLMARQYPDVIRWGGVQNDSAGFKEGWDFMTSTMKVNYKKYANKDVTILDPVLAKPGTTDFRTAINQLGGQNLQGFICMLAGGEAITFLKQAKPFGLLQSVKAVADNALGVLAGSGLKQDVPENFVTSLHWYEDAYKQYPLVADFAKAWKEEMKEPYVNHFSAFGHTAVMGYVGAIKAAKATTTEAVIGALETITFDSVFGPISYRKEDHQLKVGPGYMQFGPQAAEPGFRHVKFTRIAPEDAMEPATPGVAFKL